MKKDLTQTFDLGATATILAAGIVVGILGFVTQDGVTWRSLVTPPYNPPEVHLKVNYETIDLPEALKLYHARNTVFVDLREKKYFDYGSIQGAENLQLADIKNLATATVVRWKTKEAVVIYCNGITCPTVFFAARYLNEQGLKNIKVYDGGWPEWRSSGLPMTMSPAMKKEEVAREP